jgi:hypothetical protein
MSLLDYKNFIITEEANREEYFRGILENLELGEEDMKFLARAEKVSGFNLTEADFKTVTYKKAIQYLFKKYFFPKFDLSTTLGSVDMAGINKLIGELRSENAQGFTNLFKYKVGGIGPGEVLIYFLVNDAVIGGGSSAGADISSGGTTYELKAVYVSSANVASNFKMGGTFPDKVMPIIQEFADLLDKNGIKKTKEFNKGDIDVIKRNDPQGWSNLEAKFQEVAYENYFKNHPIIFIRNNQQPAKDGEIIAIKNVQKNEIFIGAYTSGVIKPEVKL